MEELESAHPGSDGQPAVHVPHPTGDDGGRCACSGLGLRFRFKGGRRDRSAAASYEVGRRVRPAERKLSLALDA